MSRERRVSGGRGGGAVLQLQVYIGGGEPWAPLHKTISLGDLPEGSP